MEQDLVVEGAMAMDWARVMATVQGAEEETAKEAVKEEEKLPVPAQDSGADWAMVPAPVPVVEVDWAEVMAGGWAPVPAQD